MAVYLLHFSRPIAHARHYIGFAEGGPEGVARRLERHRSGRGARLTAAAVRKGINFEIAQIWPNGDRTLERKLKNQKNGGRLCSVCSRQLTLPGVQP